MGSKVWFLKWRTAVCAQCCTLRPQLSASFQQPECWWSDLLSPGRRLVDSSPGNLTRQEERPKDPDIWGFSQKQLHPDTLPHTELPTSILVPMSGIPPFSSVPPSTSLLHWEAPRCTQGPAPSNSWLVWPVWCPERKQEEGSR